MTGAGKGVIHHLALASDWVEACARGDYRISTLGATLDEVGFVHASFAEQLEPTAARFYAEVGAPLAVLDIDTARLEAPVVVEPASDGERFPHVYGPIPVAAVVRVRPARMVGQRLVIEG